MSSGILFICVNHFSAVSTGEFVRSVLRQAAPPASEVVVVDNSVDEGEITALKEQFEGQSKVSVLATPANLGYLRGAAWGARRVAEKVALPEMVVVSNSDVVIPSTFFCAELWRRWAGRDAIVAPSAISLTGRDENPHMTKRPSVARMRAYRLLYGSPLLSRYYVLASSLAGRVVRGRIHQRGRQKVQEIYAPHGSFIVLPGNFVTGGGLEVGAFLFAEEIFIAEVARRKGIKVFYDPVLQVFHNRDGPRINASTLPFKREAVEYLCREFFANVR